jgi:hypothetical protein
MVVGWEVVVASVGDSCAYMDTGTEIIQVGVGGCVSVYVL